MKLKKVTIEKVGKHSFPTVNINSRSGLITLNLHATELLNLANGDCLDVLQDEDNADEYYLVKSTEKTPYKGRLREDNSTFVFNNTGLTRQMLSHMGVKESHATFRLAPQPADGHPGTYAILNTAIYASNGRSKK